MTKRKSFAIAKAHPNSPGIYSLIGGEDAVCDFNARRDAGDTVELVVVDRGGDVAKLNPTPKERGE